MIIPGLLVCEIKKMYNLQTWEEAVDFYCIVKFHFDAWKHHLYHRHTQCDRYLS